MKIRLALLIMTLFVHACATVQPHGAEVAAVVESHISAPSAVSKTYVLVPGNRSVTGNDLEFRKYAGYLQHILSTRGFEPANKSSEANIIIALSYGIVDPRTKKNEKPGPAWIETESKGGVTHALVTSESAASSDSNNLTNTSAYGFSGQASDSEKTTLYLRYVKIDAYENTGHQSKQLWMTKATSIGPSDNLDQIFPFLVMAVKPYLASTTDTPRFVDVLESELKANDLIESPRVP